MEKENWSFDEGMEVFKEHTFPKLVWVCFVALFDWSLYLLIGDIEYILVDYFQLILLCVKILPIEKNWAIGNKM